MDTISPFLDSRFDAGTVRHGFFGRRGGVSEGLYEGLNVGWGTKGDTNQNILHNRSLVCEAMGVCFGEGGSRGVGSREGGARDVGSEDGALLTAYQVHGDTCLYVDTADAWGAQDRPQADALVTDAPGVLIGVLTADCAPVLFRGQKPDGGYVIGAAHAGWRGALGGVLQSTVRAMIERGALQENLYAAIGPCIHRKSYEVSQEFFQQFMQQDEENERFFMAGPRADHPHFDLPGYCASVLMSAGVSGIGVLDMDTYSDEKSFFSCRRAAHKEEPDYGRQISAVVIAG